MLDLLFKKGDQTVCPNYTPLSFFGKGYSKVLKRIVWLTVKPLIEEELYSFCPSCRTTDQLFTLAPILEAAWEYSYPCYICFVDLEKAYDQVPHDDLWEVLQEYIPVFPKQQLCSDSWHKVRLGVLPTLLWE